MTATSEHPVQAQLDAYNARDIDAFMQCWADDCLYYAFPDELLARGASQVRARHLTRFQEPNLHGHLVKRIAAGNLVVDQEIVTRTFPEGPGEVDVIAIYEVTDGKIAKAWFRMGPRRLHSDSPLRRAGPSDAPTVRDLTRAAYARWVPVIGREPLPMTVDYDTRVRDHLIDLLEVEGRPAALIELVPAADHLLIENVAVAPDHQGRGYGRRLMAHAESVAASLGVSELRLYTNKSFARNVQLYRDLGYRVDREEPFRDSYTVYMSKRFQDPS